MQKSAPPVCSPFREADHLGPKPRDPHTQIPRLDLIELQSVHDQSFKRHQTLIPPQTRVKFKLRLIIRRSRQKKQTPPPPFGYLCKSPPEIPLSQNPPRL